MKSQVGNLHKGAPGSRFSNGVGIALFLHSLKRDFKAFKHFMFNTNPFNSQLEFFPMLISLLITKDIWIPHLLLLICLLPSIPKVLPGASRAAKTSGAVP